MILDGKYRQKMCLTLINSARAPRAMMSRSLRRFCAGSAIPIAASMIVVSRDGFMKWAWSSDACPEKPGVISGPAGRQSRCRRFLPLGGRSSPTRRESGVNHPAGIWFDEPVKEFSIRSEKYDLNYTLLHLSNEVHHFEFAEPHVEDTFDRFTIGRSARGALIQ